jgi:hypothetical protein
LGSAWLYSKPSRPAQEDEQGDEPKMTKHKRNKTGVTKALTYVVAVALLLTTVVVPVWGSTVSDPEFAVFADTASDESAVADAESGASETTTDAIDESETAAPDPDAARATDDSAAKSETAGQSAPQNGGGRYLQ